MDNNLYAVFGNPVLHSKSPQLFSGILDPLMDRYLRIRPQSAEDLLQLVRRLAIRGASVTAPFKEAILQGVDTLTPSARAVGAVNCIRYQGGRIQGHNTDHHGVTGPLRDAGLSLKGSTVLVLGAGGAARAAVYGLTEAGARVSISNRTEEKAHRLCDEFGGGLLEWRRDIPDRHFDAVVSTILPQGLPPFMERISCGLMLDAIYKPSRMKDFSLRKGVRVIAGEEWLIHQGVEAARFYLRDRIMPGDVHRLVREGLLKDSWLGDPPRGSIHEGNVPSAAGNGESPANGDASVSPGQRRDASLGESAANDPAQVETPGDKEQRIRVCCLTANNGHLLKDKPFDLVISAEGASDETVKQWVDEEKRLAFGR